MDLIQGKKMKRKTRKRWSQREKKILLNVLKNCDHSQIDNIAEVLPLKNKYQISRYLNKLKKTASLELKKRYYKTQHKLQGINHWISLLDLSNDTDLVMHKNLPAFISLVMEKYGVRLQSATTNFNATNLKSAYRFMFESLHNTSCSSNRVKNEVKALLFSSFNQLLEEIRSENNAVDKTFNTSVSRVLNQKSAESTVITDDGDIFATLEINPFRWTKEEIGILCQKKT